MLNYNPFHIHQQIKLEWVERLFDLLSAYGLLISRRRRRLLITQPLYRLKKYLNQIKEFEPTAANQL
jgi:hypothetical protein